MIDIYISVIKEYAIIQFIAKYFQVQFYKMPNTITQELEGVYLRNTHNAGGDNRGTRDFSLYSSTRAAAWARINTTTSTLEKVSSQVSCDIYIIISRTICDIQGARVTQYIPFSGPVVARYLGFVVESFWGLGGGLSFIQEKELGTVGESYPGAGSSVDTIYFKMDNANEDFVLS